MTNDDERDYDEERYNRELLEDPEGDRDYWMAHADKAAVPGPEEPRYPEIEVTLTGQDGNAFNVLGLVNRALQRASIPQATRTQFLNEAMAGNYDHLLATCMRWVTVK